MKHALPYVLVSVALALAGCASSPESGPGVAGSAAYSIAGMYTYKASNLHGYHGDL